MDTINHTVYKNNLTLRVLILALALFLCFSSYSKIRITIIDTGFCPNKLKLSKNVTINKVIDLTNSVKLDCNSVIASDRRYHGQHVLETLLKDIKTELIITPLIIFDKDKRQTPKYWQAAFSSEIAAQTDIFLIAAGLPYKDHIDLVNTKIEKIVFVASGIQDRWITKEDKLFPQQQAVKNDRILIISDFYPKTKYDTAYVDKKNKYQENVSYYFPNKGENDQFTGSSYAVAKALNKALLICDYKSEELFLTCLKTKSKKISIDDRKKAYTY